MFFVIASDLSSVVPIYRDEGGSEAISNFDIEIASDSKTYLAIR